MFGDAADNKTVNPTCRRDMYSTGVRNLVRSRPHLGARKNYILDTSPFSRNCWVSSVYLGFKSDPSSSDHHRRDVLVSLYGIRLLCGRSELLQWISPCKYGMLIAFETRSYPPNPPSNPTLLCFMLAINPSSIVGASNKIDHGLFPRRTLTDGLRAEGQFARVDRSHSNLLSGASLSGKLTRSVSTGISAKTKRQQL